MPGPLALNEKEELPEENVRQTKSFSRAPMPIKICKRLCDAFQTAGKRDPPSPLKTEHIRLITIGPSHYCEKARWGLDLVENDPLSPLYYTEDAHPPAFHSFATVDVSESSKSSVPMTVPEDTSQLPLHDSTAILKRYCPFLYPDFCTKEIDQIESDLDRRLGPTVRVLFYHTLFQNSKYDSYLIEIMSRNTSNIESFLMSKILNRGLKDGLKAVMKIDDTSAQVSETIRQIFEEYSKRLSDGRSYLCDTTQNETGFTAADLTLAALASPIIMPKELFPIQLQPTALPPKLQTLRRDMRETLAGQHVLRMYHKHRFGVKVEPYKEPATRGCKNSPITVRMVRLKQGQRNLLPLSLTPLKLSAVLGVAVAANSFLSKL